MKSAGAQSLESGSPQSQAIPIVFVVDDDISIRESLETLIRLRPQRNFSLVHDRWSRAAWCWMSLFRISTASNCRS
jgi:hypothetical protein